MQPVQLETNILCVSWNNDHTELAVSPHTNEVHIYAVPHAPGAVWERLHTLTAAAGVVSSVHWGARSDRIAACSHDRNAFVYVRSQAGWTPQLVRVKMGRAALCLQWNSHETKFAIGSGDMAVHVCFYDAGSRWWVSRAIRQKHSSSVVGVAWHPTQPLLATASTDRHCRVFSAGIAGVGGPRGWLSATGCAGA
jgi:actin related protein 2/3 complex, subunit 1A/1B